MFVAASPLIHLLSRGVVIAAFTHHRSRNERRRRQKYLRGRLRGRGLLQPGSEREARMQSRYAIIAAILAVFLTAQIFCLFGAEGWPERVIHE